MGKGGGPTQSTSYQTNLPEYAQPYVESMLTATQKQLFNTHQDESGNTVIDSFKEYQPYSQNVQNYFAPMSQGQNQAYAEALNMRTPGQFGQATGLSGMAGQGALASINPAYQYGGAGFGAGQTGMGYGAQGANIGQGALGYGQTAANIGNLGVAAAGQGFGAGERFARQATDPYATAAYMSPYMQNVVDAQKAAAVRDYQMAMPALSAQAVKAGAFGGSRDAVQRAEAQRNLTSQLQNIQAQGQQQAFQNAQAQQQFGANLGLQGLQAGLQGLGTGIQGQQAGMQGIQGALAGTAQGIQGAQTGIQGAQAGLQGVNAAQAGYGLANQAASNLANIGTQQQQADLARMGFQNQLGQQQQAYQQQLINQQIQDYATQQQYPLMQLGFMSNMLRGLPMQATTTQSYMPTANPLSQMIGTLGAGANIYNAFKAEGGQIKSYAKGGIASYDIGGNVKSDLYRMDQDALEEIAKNTTSDTIRDDAKQIARLKQLGLAKANGGIIAFADGKTVRGMTAEDYVIPDSEELKARREADIAAALALKAKQDADAVDAAPVVTPPADNTGITQVQPTGGRFSAQGPGTSRFRTAEQRAANPVGKTAAEIRRGNVTPDAGTAAAVRQGIVQAKKEEIKKDVADAANAEVVKDEVKKTTNAPARNDLGETPDEQKLLSDKKTDKPAQSLVGNKSDKGITSVTGTKIPGLSPTMQAFYDRALPEERSISDIIREVREARKDTIGVDTRAQERRKQGMEELANLKDEANRIKYLRQAAFFADWGSRPGPTLVAGMQAFQKYVPTIISDKEDARKAQGEVQKVIDKLDESARREEEGDFDAAFKLKTQASKDAKDLNKSMIGYIGQIEASRIRATGSDKVQQEKYLIAAQKDLGVAKRALTDLRSKNKGLYDKAAMPGEGEAINKIRSKAQEEIARLEAPHLAQIEEAQNTLNALRKHGDIVVPSKKEVESASLGTAENPIKLK